MGTVREQCVCVSVRVHVYVLINPSHIPIDWYNTAPNRMETLLDFHSKG